MSGLADIVGAAAGANPISALAGLGEKLISFIPNPQDKLAAQQALAEQQNQVLLAQIDQQNRVSQTAAANLQNDKQFGVRETFGFGMIAAFLWNSGLCQLFHQTPTQIPSLFVYAFIALLLGMAGSPAIQKAIDAATTVALAPGESSTSVLGLKLGNKS